MNKSEEIRQQFLKFFEERGHKIVSSAPVIPAGDPTLLFTNAGMNQFKDVFLGTGTREYKRAVDTQKCIRVSGKHNDLEEVGHDGTHHTFFEMLGNWSFGDYYKKEAIIYAWELITNVWKLPKGKIWASVYKKDDEAFELWKKHTDIDKSRVLKLGEKDNFWEMGEIGPCGPCSEVILDKGEEFSSVPDSNPANDDKRFVELWNLVFIQYNRDATGKLTELPQKHIDTGLGFERITAVLQGVDSNYKTDIFQPVFDKIIKISKIKDIQKEEINVALNVAADHIRALTFAIADGVIPSNEGRGYVIRRILRRAYRYGRKLDLTDPFLFKLVNPLVNKMGSVFPEIKEREEYITKMIKSEEEIFGKTLDRGLELFEDVVSRSKNNVISGADAFKLYDTYGFPVDLTNLMAKERDFGVDMTGFEKEMDKQKTRSKTLNVTIYPKIHDQRKLLKGKDTIDVKFKIEFDYNSFEIQSKIVGIFDDKNNPKEELGQGEKGSIVLKNTSFYGESGGQVGDTGIIYNDKIEFEVKDTQKADNMILHIGMVKKGNIQKNKQVTAKIDINRRKAIMRNHTATHLLHRALKDVLGEHVNQSGSLVGPQYLRFDFNHFSKLTDDEIDRIERQVNGKILENIPVKPESDIPYKEAIKKGAIALFGEKYGDNVRMVGIEDHSKELCGGTHLDSTGEIGLFKIKSESSIASGIRRIIAVTGEDAYNFIKIKENILKYLKELLNTEEINLLESVRNLQQENRNLKKELSEFQKGKFSKQADSIKENSEKIGSIEVLTGIVKVKDAKELNSISDNLREGKGRKISLIGAEINGKANLVCSVSDELLSKGKFKAGDLIRIAVKEVDGGGGGKPHFATAGGKNPKNMEKAIEAFKEYIRKEINSNV